ncbi:MAG: type II toxin-antitoxin system VapC family toxin [Thermoleophilaceae bacterium]
MLVIDASVAVRACAAADGFAELGSEKLAAPGLMWSEARSAIHETAWRGEIDARDAESARLRLEDCPVERVERPDLGPEAWAIANELGLAKTYDAEYLALARLLHCRLLTLDRRLRRGAERLGFVVGPSEL